MRAKRATFKNILHMIHQRNRNGNEMESVEIVKSFIDGIYPFFFSMYNSGSALVVECKKRKRGQDLKTIVQSLYSLELFLSLSIASIIELFVILGLSI